MFDALKKTTLKSPYGEIRVRRNHHGVPVLHAETFEAMSFGVGYCQAYDRQVQMMLVRELAAGRASEYFDGSDDLIAIDTFMRRIDFGKELDQEVEKISPENKPAVDAYCAGVNRVLDKRWRPLEFWVTGYHPRPWTISDSLITARIMGFVGLAQVQGEFEKFLLQMIQNGIPDAKLKALFPYLTENIDRDLLNQIIIEPDIIPSELFSKVLPNIHASNNWAVSGSRTASGKALLASDPHLEINRLPAIWYEMSWHLPDNSLSGVTMPGLPVVVMGRHKSLSWGATYGFMDMIDYFIEDCNDGKYRRGRDWKAFTVRKETLKPRKKKSVDLVFYENPHGVLEGDPFKPGKYLSMAFSARENSGADIFNHLMRLDNIENVQQAQITFRELTVPTFNWLFADSKGDIGYQMNGKMPLRPEGITGLLPIPGWDEKNDWQGFADPAELPTRLNPKEGYMATANNDVNRYGILKPINMAMANYRVDRISERLAESETVNFDYVRSMHYDLFSLQAKRLMPHIAPFLPDTANGTLLREWDMRYTNDSKAAYLFESVYAELIHAVFGDAGIGRQATGYLLQETSLFITYYGYFDDVLVDTQSPWFEGVNRDELFRKAITNGLQGTPKPYRSTRSFDMDNIFFGGKLPGFLGFDRRGLTLPGSRATIPQGQIFFVAGRRTSFAPSFRMVADMAGCDLKTNLPGGPSGRRFTKWYDTDLENYFDKEYKTLSCDR